MKIARIAVLNDRNAMELRWKYGLNTFEVYVGEVLSHAGIAFDTLTEVNAVSESGYDVVIAAVYPDDAPSADILIRYAENGGILILCAGAGALGKKLGFARSRNVGPGYASLRDLNDEEVPLRFLNAVPWSPIDENAAADQEWGRICADSPDGPSHGAALQCFSIGQGRLYRWSVDCFGTIVGLQQGSGPVLADGIPAPDGSGAVNDGILKADDKVEMDWELDRLRTESGQPYFAHPYADMWREAFVGSLLKAVLQTGRTLPFIGYWPDGITHVAMISHDSDTNGDEHAETTLELLRECGIRSTWCMLEPGYGRHIYPKVKEAGHELAFHFNALDMQGGHWSEEEFARQLAWLKDAADLDEVTSNKNHYTRFEGWGELFRWCERNGIASDQTRGPSKKGNVGLLFGTCQPYFPISWFDEGNRLYDVLEIGFLTQDLELPGLADNSVIRPFLEQVRRVGGVAHFLYHQKHIHDREEVRNSIRRLVREATELGFVFWTGRQINDWVRARRKLKVVSASDGKISVSGAESLQGAVVYVPVSDSEPFAEGAEEIRFGVRCRKFKV